MDPEPIPTPLQPKKPILLSILTVLLLLSTAFLAYQNSQLKAQVAALQTTPSPTLTPILDPTENWQTYTNLDYKITFRYPNDLEINGVLDSPNYIKDPNVLFTFNLIDPKTHVIKIPFTIHKSDEITDLPPNTGDGIPSTINGLEITTYATSGAFIVDQKFIRITGKDGKIYQFTYTQSLRDPKIIDQILSTFKFLPGD